MTTNAQRRFRCRRRLCADRRGTTLVEMAVAAPILFLILFGLFQFGYIFMMQHLIQNTAREGCRLAALPSSTNASVTTSINQSLSSFRITGTTTTIQINSATADLSQAVSGDNIGIVITLPIANISIIPKGYIGQSGQLTASVVRRRE